MSLAVLRTECLMKNYKEQSRARPQIKFSGEQTVSWSVTERCLSSGVCRTRISGL